MKCTITITILLILSNLSFAQQKNINLTLRNGDILSQTSIEKLIEDSVKISISGQPQWIKADSIIEIRQIKKSKFWKGAGIGLLTGTAVGAIIGRASYKEADASDDSWNFDFGPGLSTFGGAVLGGLTGTLVGGIVGASSGKDEVYDLSQKKLEQKIEIIKSIMAKKNKD